MNAHWLGPISFNRCLISVYEVDAAPKNIFFYNSQNLKNVPSHENIEQSGGLFLHDQSSFYWKASALDFISKISST